MSEPREFWIHKTGVAFNFDVMSDSPTIRTIEHTAYAAEKARADKAEKKLARCREQRNEEVNTNLLLVEWKFRNETERAAQYLKEVKQLDAELDAELGEG